MANWMSRLDDGFNKLAEDLNKNIEGYKNPSPSLNWALGNGGFVEGRLAVLYGPESGGKTLLGLLTLIEIQKKYPEGYCLLFDCEYAFNKEWFIKLGGDPKRLILRQTNDPTKIFDYWWGELLELLQDGFPLKGIMLDSVKSIVYPKDIKEVSTKMVQGGTGAAYLPSVLKRIVPIIREYGILTVFIQQVSEELDMYKKLKNPYVISDGRNLKHNADWFIEVIKVETKENAIFDGKNMIGADNQIGHKVRMKVKKNRLGAPYRAAEFSIKYKEGVCNTSDEIVDLAISLGVIYHPEKEDGKISNQMWQFSNYDPIRGEESMKKWVASNPQIQEEIVNSFDSISNEQNEKRNKKIQESGTDVDIDTDEE